MTDQPLDLDHLERVAREATPGPWAFAQSRDVSGDVGIKADGVRGVIAECFADMQHAGECNRLGAAANAAHIAAFDPPTVLALISRLRAAEARAAEARADDAERRGWIMGRDAALKVVDACKMTAVSNIVAASVVIKGIRALTPPQEPSTNGFAR